jgi:hypothetical protein
MLIGAGAGIAGQYGIDVFNNYQKNGFALSDLYSGLSGPQTYAIRALHGGIIGATGGFAGAGYFGSSLLVQSAIVGGTSGAAGA